MVNQKHHYFFACKLPKEIKNFLHNWIEERREDYPFLKWVHPEDYHITLVFLGFVDESRRNELIEKVKPILSKKQSFSLTLNKLGIFGRRDCPRIFWAGVNESESLNGLQKNLFEVCEKLQFSLDKKPFNPHITLARKWGSKENFNEEQLISITNEGNQVTFPINEIVLYETHLEKNPKYKEYEVFTLQ